MKIVKILRNITVLSAVLFSSTAFAYNAGNLAKECKAPKFRDYVPPEKTKNTPVPEVEAESKIEFTVSGNADPSTIVAKAKKLPLKLTITDRNSFYLVSASLPAALNGKYARIDLKVKAHGGECFAKDGWLIKIKKASEASEPKAEKIEKE
ncbi:MAG: hypothetical protein KAH20_08450 [Methylococcales bacterium]|nr:hypothetical protein [Methylococcales bacterium]